MPSARLTRERPRPPAATPAKDPRDEAREPARQSPRSHNAAGDKRPRDPGREPGLPQSAALVVLGFGLLLTAAWVGALVALAVWLLSGMF